MFFSKMNRMQMCILAKLTLSGKIADNASRDAEADASPRVEVTGGRGGGDEAGDGTRAPADHGPLAGQPPIENAPAHRSEHGRQVAVPAGHGGAEVGAEGGAAVEAEPAKPQENGAESHQRDVVRAEVEHHLLLAPAKNQRVRQRRHAGHDLDGPAAGVVEAAPREEPSVGVPSPARDRAVHNRRPEEGEDHGGDDAAALSDGAHGDGGGDCAELHLWERKIR